MDFQTRKRLAIFLLATGIAAVLAANYINAETFVLGIAIGVLGYCMWPKAPGNDDA